jgi:hypothetical protein
MLQIHNMNLSNKILKEFPGLGHTKGYGYSWKSCKGEYVLHDVSRHGGTGRLRIEQGLPHIEGAWEPVRI